MQKRWAASIQGFGQPVSTERIPGNLRTDDGCRSRNERSKSNMQRRTSENLLWLVGVIVIAGTTGLTTNAQRSQPQRELPQFQVDPARPKALPNNWVFGLVSGINVDSQNHIWIIHRPHTIRPEHKGRAAPAVVEFDQAGNFIQAWGAPGAGYEWP